MTDFGVGQRAEADLADAVRLRVRAPSLIATAVSTRASAPTSVAESRPRRPVDRLPMIAPSFERRVRREHRCCGKVRHCSRRQPPRLSSGPGARRNARPARPKRRLVDVGIFSARTATKHSESKFTPIGVTVRAVGAAGREVMRAGMVDMGIGRKKAGNGVGDRNLTRRGILARAVLMPSSIIAGVMKLVVTIRRSHMPAACARTRRVYSFLVGGEQGAALIPRFRRNSCVSRCFRCPVRRSARRARRAFAADYVTNAGDIVKAADWRRWETVTVELDEHSFAPQDLKLRPGSRTSGDQERG